MKQSKKKTEKKVNWIKANQATINYHITWLLVNQSWYSFFLLALSLALSLGLSLRNKITYNNIVSICICLQCRATLQVSVVVIVDGIVVAAAAAAKAACFLCMLSQQEQKKNNNKIRKKTSACRNNTPIRGSKSGCRCATYMHYIVCLEFFLLYTPNRTTENWNETKRNENKIKSNLRKCKQKPKLSRNVLQLHSCVQWRLLVCCMQHFYTWRRDRQ